MCLAWLVLITCLHHWRGMAGISSHERIKVGYLPITCHILCPVTLEHLSGNSRAFQAIKFSSWPEMIEALRGGKLDIAFILAPIAVALRAQGVGIKVVLLGHRDGTALVVQKSPPVSSLRDLEGGTIAIPIRFSCQNLALLRLCVRDGVDPNALNIVELPPPDMPSALASGGIHGYIVGEPYAAQAELTDTGRVLYQMKDVWPGFISSVVVVREEVLSERRSEVLDLIRAFYMESLWVEGHRRKAARMAAGLYGLPEHLIEYVLTTPPDRVSYENLVPKPEEFDEICRSMRNAGLIDTCPAGSDLVDTSWLPDQAGDLTPLPGDRP